MRALTTCFVLSFVALAAAGCGDDGGAAAAEDDRAATCAALASMAEPALAVEQANVADPEAFEAALDTAVDDYLASLDELREVAPATLDNAIDEIEGAVDDRDFETALAARAPLDEYVATECAAPRATTTDDAAD